MSSKRYKQQRQLKPKHSRFKKLLKNRFLWFGVAGLFVVMGIFYGVFFTPFFQIQHIEVQGNQKVSTEKLNKLAEENISKNFLFFKTNHLFFANVGKVAEEITGSFPEIETVVVDTTFPNKVEVFVQERRGVAIWCQQKEYTVEISEEEEKTTRSFRQCFALDSNGVIFEKKEPEREVIIQNGRSDVVLGEKVIEPELLSKILTFQKELDSSMLFVEVGLRVSTLSVISEERVDAKISEGWEIYINPAENIDWQTTKVELVLEQEIPFEKRPTLEYIDLRFGDQAYIKYRE